MQAAKDRAVLERRAAALAANIARRPKEAYSEEYARALFAQVCREIRAGTSVYRAFEICIDSHSLPPGSFRADRNLRKTFEIALEQQLLHLLHADGLAGGGVHRQVYREVAESIPRVP